jgi:hypothetical protein
LSWIMAVKWSNNTTAADIDAPLSGDRFDGHATNSHTADHIKFSASEQTATAVPHMIGRIIRTSEDHTELMAHPSDVAGWVTIGYQIDKNGARFFFNGVPLRYRDYEFPPSFGTYLFRSMTLGMAESPVGSMTQLVSGHKVWNKVVSADTMMSAHQELMARLRHKGIYQGDVANSGDVMIFTEGDSWTLNTDPDGLTWPQYVRSQFSPRLIGGNFGVANSIMSSRYAPRNNSAWNRLPKLLESIRMAKRLGKKVIVILKMDTNDMPSMAGNAAAQLAYEIDQRDWGMYCKDAGADVLMLCAFTAISSFTTGMPAATAQRVANATAYDYIVPRLDLGIAGDYTTNSATYYANINHLNAAGIRAGIEDIILPLVQTAVTDLRAT